MSRNNLLRWITACIVLLAACASMARAQDNSDPATSGNSGNVSTGTPAVNSGQGSGGASPDPELKKTLQEIQDYLKQQKQDESDFGLVLGIGSLLTAPNVTDYQNESNVLNVTHLGKATPQLLTGVSFRTRVPSLFTRFGCPGRPKRSRKDTLGGASGKGAPPSTASSSSNTASNEDNGNSEKCYGEIWQRNPWSAFVSLKFAPGASNPINGYVLGGSFNLAHHLAFVVGFALTPINEPSPGFRTLASQFVQQEQQQGLYMNFDPTAMLKGTKNAFDGFPLTNPSTGALIYPGNALVTHYHGGVVLGISMPIAFSSFLRSGGGNAPATSNAGGESR